MIVALAGVPGVGKSYLAAALNARFGWRVLDRDRIRDALFPPELRDYSAEQNELASQIAYQTASYIVRVRPREVVVLDGRPFSRREQRIALRGVGAELQVPVAFVHCVASEETVCARLAVVNANPAADPRADRSEQKYRDILGRFEPFTDEVVLKLCTEEPLQMQVQAVAKLVESLR